MGALKNIRWGVMGCCALALACGSSEVTSPTPTPQKTASLTISTAATKVRVGGAEVAMSANLENSTEAVSWVVEGPGSLTASSGLANSFAPPAALAASQTAKITAMAGALKASASIEVVANPPEVPATCDVKGLVVDEDNNPVYNETAWIAGHDVVASDGNGVFVIQGVAAPYDLAVTAERTKTTYVYKGLTTCEPKLFLWRTPDDRTWLPARDGRITGHVNGTLVNLGVTKLSFASPEVDNWYDPDALAFHTHDVGAGEATYAVDAEWNGPGLTSGQLVALTYAPDPMSGLPIQYWMAYTGASIISGLPFQPGPDLFLQPVASDTVQGTITMPPTYFLMNKFLALQFAGGNNIGIFSAHNGDMWSNTNAFLYEVPDFAGATSQVCAQANDGLDDFAVRHGVSVTCNGKIPNQDGVKEIVLRHAPEGFSPGPDAEGIDLASKFNWQPLTLPDQSADPAALYVVYFKPETRGVDDHNPKYVIITAATQTKLPDLRDPLGQGYFPDTDYRWQVYGMGPFASVDEFVKMDRKVAVPPFQVQTAPVAEAYWARSVFKKFSTCDVAGVTPCPR